MIDKRDREVLTHVNLAARQDAYSGSMTSATFAPPLAACFHCGGACPAGPPWHAPIGEEVREFCCAGCLAVAQTIAGAGLDGFYRTRTALALRPEAAADVLRRAGPPRLAVLFACRTTACTRSRFCWRDLLPWWRSAGSRQGTWRGPTSVWHRIHALSAVSGE